MAWADATRRATHDRTLTSRPFALIEFAARERELPRRPSVDDAWQPASSPQTGGVPSFGEIGLTGVRGLSPGCVHVYWGGRRAAISAAALDPSRRCRAIPPSIARGQRGASRVSPAHSRPRRLRQLVFSLIPAVLVLGVLEIGARFASSAAPSLRSLPLPAESEGLFQPDADLFWSFKPGLDTHYLGTAVRTDSLGLRSEYSGLAVGPKPASEIRVLSLGESTTFGSGVSASETYTASFAHHWSALRGSTVRAFNGGVPAYSSFQSLRLLETRGLALDPDIVLFYHELNDYLPSSLRDATNTEIGVLQTDPQLARARDSFWMRLSDRSALVRSLRMLVARRRVEAFDSERVHNPLQDIGLPDIGLPPRMVRDGTRTPAQVDEAALGRRVSDNERVEIFDRMIALSEEHGFELVLFHPAYQLSRPHECLLTSFARERAIALFDVQMILHPPGSSREDFYRDAFHPNAAGHARIGEALASWLHEREASLHGGGDSTH